MVVGKSREAGKFSDFSCENTKKNPVKQKLRGAQDFFSKVVISVDFLLKISIGHLAKSSKFPLASQDFH